MTRLDETSSGEQAVIRALVRHRAWLFQHVNPRLAVSLRRHVSAQDIVQTVCAYAVENAASFRDGSTLKVRRWLTAIANREIVRVWREQSAAKRGGGRGRIALRDIASSVEAAMKSLHAPGRTPSSQAAIREAGRNLAHALVALPPRQRTAFLLRYADGLTNAEIAEIMRLSMEGVNGLLFRARRTLGDDAQLCLSTGRDVESKH